MEMNNIKFLNKNSFGGFSMQRLTHLSIFAVILTMFGFTNASAEEVVVSGKIAPNDVMVFLKDNDYVINKSLVVGGTLIIEPGTKVIFYPNGRLIDSTGGRIIADGFANVEYNANPALNDVNGTPLNPVAISGTNANPNTPLSYNGYSDLNYFLHGRNNNTSSSFSVVDFSDTKDEHTVHDQKENLIYNVVLDTVSREIKNLQVDNAGNPIGLVNNRDVVVSYQEAMMFKAARMDNNPGNDVNLRNFAWSRLGDKPVEISEDVIEFVGQPTTNFSREFGHIVILPGARAAYFRNCLFRGMKKDTTVDRVDLYTNNQPAFPWATNGNAIDWNQINNDIRLASNGSGGAITTFSSRTWLLNCSFEDNIAKIRGGAVQFLEAPRGYPALYVDLDGLRANAGVYPLDKNPYITDPDGSVSSINDNPLTRIPAIDRADEPAVEPLTDLERMAYDDSRLSIFLGRFRNNSFSNNEAVLADYGIRTIGNQTIGLDLDSASYPYGTDYTNGAYGGAIYIAGRSDNEFRRLEVGIGINNGINIDENGDGVYQPGEMMMFEEADTFIADANRADNRQYNADSKGARGGAIYIGEYTSLILAGQFSGNEANARYYTQVGTNLDGSNYSRGGAIFHENTLGRLQLRGGPARDNVSNPTHFTNNLAAAGGALYVDGNVSDFVSPVIGGTDDLLETRNFGYNILFRENVATIHGGAIFTKRNYWINGAGGVENNQIIGYGGKYPVRIWNNSAGLSGGGIHVEIPDAQQVIPQNKRNLITRRASFRNNEVGMGIENETRESIRGGGALYVLNGDVNVVQASEFVENIVRNGNGAAIAQISPKLSTEKFFVSDLDEVIYSAQGVARDYNSSNNVFTRANNPTIPADTRMLTRFYENEIILDADPEFVNAQMGNGSTTNLTAKPRLHKTTDLPENGIGLGGGLYILDRDDALLDRSRDSVHFNRVRMQGNVSYSGPAVYSDNWDLKLIFNRSLITSNVAYSNMGGLQNVIRGPIERDGNGEIEANTASSDLVGATIYGEVLGPLPSSMYSEAANSIYNNDARFLIRLPDAPDTKGVLAGTRGLGFGGTDTLRGNYWGRTEANIRVDYENIISNNVNYNFPDAGVRTFFIAGDGNTWLPFKNSWVQGDDPREQGPHESLQRYNYENVPLRNMNQGQANVDENTSASFSIPENLLFSGRIYDIHDKGTDIKRADYSARRMSPIEDFAVGIPPLLKDFDVTNLPSNGKYVKRFVRDPFCLEDDRYSEFMTPLQKEYSANTNGDFYHPIGQPLFLEAEADYDGLTERSNHNPYLANETVFFVINETTGDFIRTNLMQVSEDAPNRETFRSRVDFIPDSSNRIPNTSIRRTSEGLFNLGTGQQLLQALADNPMNEDRATLFGRKYSNNEGAFGNISSIFSNRPSLPADNNGNATFFAGERYRTLPVNVGDVIRVVSRTVLWQEGVVPAFDGGLSFRISAGIENPQFTGDIVTLRDVPIFERRPAERENDPNELENNEIIEYRNTVFVREDRSYPAQNGSYGPQTRDSILSITAIDSNNFYDPRAIFTPSRDNFTFLTYEWDVQNNSGLENWIMVDTLTAGDGTTNVRDGAVGYQQFRGTPMNPYVVPGGESVRVTAYSYPPNFRTIDSLKATFGWENDNDTLAKFIELYPEYFHAESYMNDDARYLQQDTVDMAVTANRTYASDYEFDIFVVDSVPVWLDWAYNSTTITRDFSDGSVLDTQVVYEPSLRACVESEDTDGDGVRRLVANLTDKLRFQADINTTDELEDMWAAKVHNWDFRYGRTAYGFQNRIVSGQGSDGSADTVIIDSTYYIDENDNEVFLVNQNRPAWLANEYLYEYNTDDTQDMLNQDFITNGQINVRIDRAEALNLLSREDDVNGALNLDTAMTVIVNDGHGGKIALDYDIYVNVAPEIITDNLENAKEDERYNPQLLNIDRAIRVSDLNFDQTHTFELIYEGDYANNIDKDLCFTEAGQWIIDQDYFDETPDWLRINPTSGILYGTPGVTDAPRTVNVSVLVTDSEGLTAVRNITLVVEETGHNPDIVAVPSTDCFDIGGEYSDSIRVSDIDLLRDVVGFEETVTIEVIEPAVGFTVTPSSFTGPLDDEEQRVVISSTNIPAGIRGPDGKGKITVRITDSDGNERTETYTLNLSDPVDFVCKLDITNSIGAFEELYWGTAGANDPTTGDGKDGDPEIGKLDDNFCEYELPPLPTVDVFDARWTHPTTNGLARTIYPNGTGIDENIFVYKATIQPGGENGNVSGRYPLTIEWDKTCIPEANDGDRNPNGSNWYLLDGFSNGDFFTVEMRTGDNKGFETVTEDNDIVTLTITNTTINSVIILSDVFGDVEDETSMATTGITSVSPNPISEDAKIEFVVAQTGDVVLEIVDLFGNVVTTLENTVYPAGTYEIAWDGVSETGQRLAAGAYNVRLVTGGQTSTMPIRLVK